MLEASIKKCRDQLTPDLGTATELFYEGQQVGSWRPNKVFDEDSFARDFPAHANRFSDYVLNRSELKREHKKVYETYMVEPQSPQEQTRVLRIKGEAFKR